MHNALRALHGSPKMDLDDELNDMAQAHADKLAAHGTFEHSKTKVILLKGQGLSYKVGLGIQIFWSQKIL